MVRNTVFRGLHSFVYAIAINVVLYALLMAMSGREDYYPMLPEYMAHFSSPQSALMTQCILIGIVSAAFGAGSVIMETERIGLIAQSVIYFVFTSAVMVPVACFCWGLHKYPGSMIGVGVSYIISYGISWGVQYRVCRRNIAQINSRLAELQDGRTVESMIR